MDRTEKPPEILTPLHKRVLDALFAEEAFAGAFYLTGGTALAAFYLKHRHSDDLDFFTNGAEGRLPGPIHLVARHRRRGVVPDTPGEASDVSS